MDRHHSPGGVVDQVVGRPALVGDAGDPALAVVGKGKQTAAGILDGV